MRVYSTATDGKSEDAAASMAPGMRYQRVQVDARQEDATMPLISELKLYDPVALYYSGVLAEGSLCRILGIAEAYPPSVRRYETTLMLGAE